MIQLIPYFCLKIWSDVVFYRKDQDPEVIYIIKDANHESAGCEAFRAERPVDEIRSPLLPGAKRPATTKRLT